MLTPRVGDTVILKGIVKSIHPEGFYIETPNQKYNLYLNTNRISEVIPQLWEPKVGDKCQNQKSPASKSIFEILGVRGETVWLGWPGGSSLMDLKDLKRWYIHVDA